MSSFLQPYRRHPQLGGGGGPARGSCAAGPGRRRMNRSRCLLAWPSAPPPAHGPTPPAPLQARAWAACWRFLGVKSWRARRGATGRCSAAWRPGPTRWGSCKTTPPAQWWAAARSPCPAGLPAALPAIRIRIMAMPGRALLQPRAPCDGEVFRTQFSPDYAYELAAKVFDRRPFVPPPPPLHLRRRRLGLAPSAERRAAAMVRRPLWLGRAARRARVAAARRRAARRPARRLLRRRVPPTRSTWCRPE
jgi:hypothetical protein